MARTCTGKYSPRRAEKKVRLGRLKVVRRFRRSHASSTTRPATCSSGEILARQVTYTTAVQMTRLASAHTWLCFMSKRIGHVCVEPAVVHERQGVRQRGARSEKGNEDPAVRSASQVMAMSLCQERRTQFSVRGHCAALALKRVEINVD
jgi:hypothetical protein